jgi:hypothetical protein
MAAGMAVGKIEITERNEGRQGNQGIDTFKSQGPDASYAKGTYRDCRADNMRPAEHEPPEND